MMPKQIRYVSVAALFTGCIGLVTATAMVLGTVPPAPKPVASDQRMAVAGSQYFKDPNGPWPGGRIWLGTRPATAAAGPEAPRVSIAIDRRGGLDI